MPDLLFISHRIPYPLNKGEKIRGHNLISHLSKTYRVHLGCLIDDPSDWAGVEVLRRLCADIGAFGIDRRVQKFKALAQIRPGQPLMLNYYHHRGLRRWVDRKLSETSMDVILIYSTAMAPYVLDIDHPLKLLDMQDIDSEKWDLYARKSRWPMRAIWAREARNLLAYERIAASRSQATFLVTQPEVQRFAELAPESAHKVDAIEMGVDLDSFAPNLDLPRPYSSPGPHIVFTGNMDYWPNADAATWFAHEVLPGLQQQRPGICFHVVGNRPGPDILALAKRPGINVTGRVPDVRPYVAHADVSVSTLRMARGVQNKVLEAMALGKPVVSSPQAFEGIKAVAGRDLLVADGAQETTAAVLSILNGEHPHLGVAARAAMERSYSWENSFRKLDDWIARTALPNGAAGHPA